MSLANPARQRASVLTALAEGDKLGVIARHIKTPTSSAGGSARIFRVQLGGTRASGLVPLTLSCRSEDSRRARDDKLPVPSRSGFSGPVTSSSP